MWYNNTRKSITVLLQITLEEVVLMHVCISPLNLVFGGLRTHDKYNCCNLEHCCINNQASSHYSFEEERRQVVVFRYSSEGKKKTPLQRNAFNLRKQNEKLLIKI